MKNLYRCLIIEDELHSARLIGNYLRDYKNFYTPRYAQSIAEAASEIKNHRFDMIFCDIHLPDGNSLDLLKSNAVQVPAILITGDKNHSLEAYEMDIIDYIVKPVGRKRFDKAVGKTLEVILGRKQLQTNMNTTANLRKVNNLEKILTFRYNLTPTESVLCKSINEGKTVDEILDAHSISLNTYKTHMRHIFSKTIDRSIDEQNSQRKLQRLTMFLFSLREEGIRIC